MRHCSSCGEMNEDGYLFCSACGNRLISEQKPETQKEDDPEQEQKTQDEADDQERIENSESTTTQEESPQTISVQPTAAQPIEPSSQPTAAQPIEPSSQPTAAQGTVPTLVQNPVIAAIRNAGSSTLFLVAVILFTSFIFLNILNAAIPTPVEIDDNVIPILESIGEEFNFDLVTMAMQGGLQPNAAQIIFANLFNIIIAIGLWMFYASSKKPGIYSIAGLKVIKTITIIRTVLICLLFAVIELLLFISIAMLPRIMELIPKYRIDEFLDINFNISAVLSIMIIVFIVIFALVFAFALTYYLFIIGTINTVQKSIIFGAASDRVSSYVAVINIIIAVSTVMPILFLLFSGSIISALAALANSAFLVVISVCIFNYKKTMRNMIFMHQIQNTGK